MKKVLVITYSQSGQLTSIVNNVITSLEEKHEIIREELKPVPDFPFPWKDVHFWDAQPECVELIPGKIQSLSFNPDDDYDLIILGYPIWFLSPPTPLTTFLKSPEAKKVINGKPIITIIGCRNMWVSAQEDVKRMISANGGKLVGNIVLRDRAHNLPSVVTIIYWMTTGRKERLWGIFPMPGVSEKDIIESSRFGEAIKLSLESGDYSSLQTQLIDLNAVEIQVQVLSLERKGKKIFGFWSKFIRKKGEPGNPARIPRLKMFKWYLLFVIFVVSPIATLVFWLTYPLFYFQIKKNLKYFSGVSLKK